MVQEASLGGHMASANRWDELRTQGITFTNTQGITWVLRWRWLQFVPTVRGWQFGSGGDLGDGSGGDLSLASLPLPNPSFNAMN